MKRWGIWLSTAAALFVQGGMGLAADKDEKWETAIVPDKPQPVVLKPDKAYILVSSKIVTTPIFMRLPTSEDAASHAQRRADALAKEHAKWKKNKLPAWQADMKQFERHPKVLKKPVKPIEPTDANFSYPAYERTHVVFQGPQNRFSKDAMSVYLQEVPPGEYLFYGVATTCACFGTVSFEAPAGKVTALELSFPLFDAAQELPAEQRPKTAFDLPVGTTSLRLDALEASDPRLPVGSVAPAILKPAGRWPNWFGIEADRLMPIEGLFAYDRDRQVGWRSPVATETVAEEHVQP